MAGRGSGAGHGRAGRRRDSQKSAGIFRTKNKSRDVVVSKQDGRHGCLFLPSGKQFSGSMASSAISEYSSSSSPGFLRSTVLPSDRLTSSFCWLKQETSAHQRKQLTFDLNTPVQVKPGLSLLLDTHTHTVAHTHCHTHFLKTMRFCCSNIKTNQDINLVM